MQMVNVAQTVKTAGVKGKPESAECYAMSQEEMVKIISEFQNDHREQIEKGLNIAPVPEDVMRVVNALMPAAHSTILLRINDLSQEKINHIDDYSTWAKYALIEMVTAKMPPYSEEEVSGTVVKALNKMDEARSRGKKKCASIIAEISSDSEMSGNMMSAYTMTKDYFEFTDLCPGEEAELFFEFKKYLKTKHMHDEDEKAGKDNPYPIYADGAEAGWKIILSYAKMVCSYAMEYVSGDTERYVDYVSIGLQTLYDCLGKFDSSQPTVFYTYGRHCLANAYKKENLKDKGYVYHTGLRLKKINDYSREFKTEKGRYPTNAEIADHFGMTEKGVDNLTKIETVKVPLQAYCSVTDDGAEYDIPDPKASFEAEVEDRVFREQVIEMAGSLPTSNQRAVMKSIVNNTGKPTVTHVAELAGTSKQTAGNVIRQISACPLLAEFFAELKDL